MSRRMAFRYPQAHRMVNEASEEQWQSWLEIGEAATAAHAAGFRSFGTRKRSAEEALGPVQRPEPPHEDISREAQLALVLDAEKYDDWARQAARAVAAAVEQREQRDAENQELHDWVADNTANAKVEMTRGGIDHEGSSSAVACLPVRQGEHILQWVDWCPPGSTLAEKALRGDRRKMAQVFNIRKKLTGKWLEAHWGLRHEQAPRLTVPDQRLPPCFLAGFCICNDAIGHWFANTITALMHKQASAKRCASCSRTASSQPFHIQLRVMCASVWTCNHT